LLPEISVRLGNTSWGSTRRLYGLKIVGSVSLMPNCWRWS
jgi:hypothetical protein